MAENNPNAGYDGDYGTLEVQVFAADRAIPLSGVNVIVSKPSEQGEELLKIMKTNQNGITEEIKLPALPASNSMSPGGSNLFYVYNIRTDLPGYYSVENVNVPIFAGHKAIQPVRMIPLPENKENGKKVIFVEKEPVDL